MPWWMKQILLFLSILLFFGCSEELKPEDTDLVESKSLLETFFETLEHFHEKDFHQQIDLMVAEINQSDLGIVAYGFDNPIDHGKILFTAKVDSLLAPLSELADQLTKERYTFDEYTVWRTKINQINVLELSRSPHPTEGFIFMIRERLQE